MTKRRSIGLVATLAGLAVLVWVLNQIFHAGVFSSLVAVAVAAGILRLGWGMVAGLAQVPPAPPEPGLLRKVKITYRCSNCGAEVRMTVAPDEDPEPPRHCMEDMDLVAPIE